MSGYVTLREVRVSSSNIKYSLMLQDGKTSTCIAELTGPYAKRNALRMVALWNCAAQLDLTDLHVQQNILTTLADAFKASHALINLPFNMKDREIDEQRSVYRSCQAKLPKTSHFFHL